MRRSCTLLHSPSFRSACQSGRSGCKRVNDLVCCRPTDDDQYSRPGTGSDLIFAALSGRSDRNHHPVQVGDSGISAYAWISVSGQDPLDQGVSHLSAPIGPTGTRGTQTRGRFSGGCQRSALISGRQGLDGLPGDWVGEHVNADL